jgi:hypothetical protein
MTKLLWDRVGERLYEAGLDRGVLYLSNGIGVAWNGMTSVDEDMSEDSSSPAYFDGVKYMDVPSTGDFEATLTALTYPDEFLDYEGIEGLGGGLYVDGQGSKFFGLSYRTLVGNDTEGTSHGYKIHILYNLTAVANAVNYETITNSPSPIPFTWKITGVPQDAPNYRPTAHVIFDSRYLNAELFEALEAILYGDVDDDPTIPSISELLDFVTLFGPKLINPNTVTGLSPLTNGDGDLTATNTDGIFSALPNTRLVETAVDGFYQLIP